MSAPPDVVERRSGGTGTALGPPWRVIVLNDEHNTFESVARSLSAVLPKVGYRRGLTFANPIHQSGIPILWTGRQELAELYHEQLASRGLTMAPLEQG